MFNIGFTLLPLVTLALTGPLQDSAAIDSAFQEFAFPVSTALAEGVSPEALGKLGELVQSLVDNDEIVGAELLVIKNGRSILHEAFGWRDREAEVAMDTGSVFCVRSMTKPLIGTSILMLVEDKQLKLSDRIGKFLPEFDVESTHEISIENLLQHTSGMPMSLIMGMDLNGLTDIRSVADLGGGYELEFEPGSDFNYSDQGTDTLTALIEVVTGMTAVDFVRTRVLEPLGMEDSACVMTEGHPLRARGCSKYAGSRGNWTRFWDTSKPPLFPFFLGSQGLYSTVEDYARFMDFWRRKGRTVEGRLLTPRYARKALKPGPYPLGGPTGLPELRTEYGYLMQLWTEPVADEKDERKVVAFGHTGSDGTHAWVFPEQNAMVLYFTQSRGTTTGLQVEQLLGEIFLGVAFDANQAAPPMEPYLGYYWEGEGDLYRAIIRDGEDMSLEIMGRGVVALDFIGEDRWRFRENPSIVLAFDRSEAGDVTGYHIGDHQEFRFEPSPDLPSAVDLAKRVSEVHRFDLLESLGPMRWNSTVDLVTQKITAEQSTLLAWPTSFRYDGSAGEVFETIAYDGKQVRYASSNKPAATVAGERAELLRLDNPLARFGDWKIWHSSLTVIQRLERGGASLVLVRTGDTSGPASTLYIDEQTGRLKRETGLIHVDMAGRMGRKTSFGDYRDVSGILVPFRIETEMAHPLIGTVVTKLLDVEVGVELSDDAFNVP